MVNQEIANSSQVESGHVIGEDDFVNGVSTAVQRVDEIDAIVSVGEVNLKPVCCTDPTERCVSETISVDDQCVIFIRETVVFNGIRPIARIVNVGVTSYLAGDVIISEASKNCVIAVSSGDNVVVSEASDEVVERGAGQNVSVWCSDDGVIIRYRDHDITCDRFSCGVSCRNLNRHVTRGTEDEILEIYSGVERKNSSRNSGCSVKRVARDLVVERTAKIVAIDIIARP